MKKRVLSLMLVLILCFSLLSHRIYLISVKNIYAVNSDNTLKSNTVSFTRGNIYDTNFKKITNTSQRYIACIKPTAKSFIEIEELPDTKAVEAELKKGKLVTVEVPQKSFFKQSNDILTLTVYERYKDNTLSHILGYCNGNKGLYGIEKYYDDILKNTSGSLTLKYHCDALGRVLNGEPVEIHNDNYNNTSGLVLTIDLNIQKIVEEALNSYNIDVGACVVLSVSTSEILACASTPFINRDNLSESLENKNSPFLNRAFSSYPVGSVFKVVTAAAALEAQKADLFYECSGSIIKSGNTFNCNKKDGHGKMDLNSAITNSCNPFFIELGCKIGADALLKTATDLGFNKATDFGNGYMTDSGNLPSKDELNSSAAIGNFAFGQSSLLATPLQIASCYATIANKGIYNEPTLIKGYIDENENFTGGSKATQKKALTENTCKILKECLYDVVKNGTGKAAFSSLFDSCGKTATAETGQFDENGNKLKHSWYVGFFPFEKPEYVICVMKENGVSGGIDCAPVFKKIAEDIYISNRIQNSK